MTITKCSKCGKRYLIPGFLFHTWPTHKCEKKKWLKKINDRFDNIVDKIIVFFFIKWGGITTFFLILFTMAIACGVFSLIFL